MNDFDQSFLEFQAAEQARRYAEGWLAAFEAALVSRDVALIGNLFHPDCHWQDHPGLHMAPDTSRGPRQRRDAPCGRTETHRRA